MAAARLRNLFAALRRQGYDLIYRDPRLWRWALTQQRPSAADAWQ